MNADRWSSGFSLPQFVTVASSRCLEENAKRKMEENGREKAQEGTKSVARVSDSSPCG
jgi:hypothetical protein